MSKQSTPVEALTHSVLVVLVAAIMVVTLGALGKYSGGEVDAAASPPESRFSYGRYAAILRAYVDDRGMVDYKSLQKGRRELDLFARQLASVDPREFENWRESGKIAFWVNAYNALTLVAIIDSYPIRASGFLSWRYPKNSIRQIPGVWTKLKFSVLGRRMTLDAIEHKVLRKQFNEPRIHMALVCAAMSCPSLRNEPYTGKRLDAQLRDQTLTFVAHRSKFRLERKSRRVYLSPIFKWFGEDFEKAQGAASGFRGHGATERAVLNFVAKHLSKADAGYLKTAKYSISYLTYDWSLNEQVPESSSRNSGTGGLRGRGLFATEADQAAVADQ